MNGLILDLTPSFIACFNAASNANADDKILVSVVDQNVGGVCFPSVSHVSYEASLDEFFEKVDGSLFTSIRIH